MAAKHLVHLVAAARPNFMKIAPLYRALASEPDFEAKIVHTGQHYDANMSAAFFDDLGLPEPHHHLGVGSGTHAEQTGRVMMRYEETVLQHTPDVTVVVGDVNSTAAVAMVCAKLHLPVVHLEAGLRSGDRTMPEEINRLITDALADLLWTPSPDADENLRREGVPAERIHRVGNIMIDSYELMRESIEADDTRNRLGLDGEDYCVVTLHRPSNVDEREPLGVLVDQLTVLGERIGVVFPVHPRTRGRLEEFGLLERLSSGSGIQLVEPMGYIQFMQVVQGAKMTITDSGGIQEETTYLDIPCLTIRPNTERPITISEGTNKLVRPSDLITAAERVIAGNWPSGRQPDLWDGKTAGRCVVSLRGWLESRS